MTLHTRTKNHVQGGLPGVNLLSASALDRLTVRTLRRRFVAAGVALVVLLALGVTLQQFRIAAAERVLAEEQAATAQLRNDTLALAPIQTFVAGVAVQEQTIETTMSGEIATSRVLAALQDAAPTGLQLETLMVTAAPAPTGPPAADGVPVVSPCPGPDPFTTRTVIGCVTLAGTAVDRVAVADLVIRLGSADVFVEPFITTTTTADGTGVSFSGSVGLSPEAYSGRYGVPADPVEPEEPTDPTDPATGESS